MCATLLSDTERDIRISNACSTTMPKENDGKQDLSDSAEPQEDMPKKTKKFQSTISIFLERKMKDSGENKQMGFSSIKTSAEEVKEFQTLKQSEVHDFYVDDTNIDSQTSKFESSLSSSSKASLFNDGSSFRVCTTASCVSTSSSSNEGEIIKDPCFE